MKRFLPSSKIFTTLFVVMSLFFIETAIAQRVASVSGNWNNTATWGGSAVPTGVQTVTINAGVTVTITANAVAGILIVNGTLNVTGGNLTMANNGSVTNNSGGSIVFSSTNVINGGGNGNNGVLIDINAGSSLTTAHANGFNNATGSFQHNPGNKGQSYDIGANYTYNGGTQNTGANLPTGLTGSLTINSSGTVTLNSPKSIGNGGTIHLEAGTFATGSNLTMGSSSSIVRSGGDVTGTFQGTGIYNVTYTGNSKTTGIELVNGGLNNVTVNLTSGQTLTLDANRAPDGNLNISSGIFDLSTFTINRSAAGGTLTVSNGTSLRVGGTNTFPSNYSTHSIGNTSTVEYFGTAQTVSNLNSSQSYGNLIFSGAGTKTLSSGTLGIAGNWTIGSTTAANTNNPAINLTGNFNLNSGTFSSTSGTFSLAGNWTNSATFTAGTGTVNFNGTTQSITTTTFNNLSLTNSGVKTFSNTITTNANLSIASGVQANLGTGLTHPANSLTLGGLGTNLSTWGSTTSSATYKNNTYFTGTTGVINVTINTAATPTVTPTVGTYTYTGLPQGPNAATNTGTVTSYTFSYVGVSGTTYGPSATQPTNAGNYTVTATVGDSSDGFYRTANSSATSFTIAVRALTITADNASKCFGTTYTLGTSAFTTSVGGLQNGETILSVTLTSSGAASGAAVGSYPITPSAASGTFTTSNYNITYADGSLTVIALPNAPTGIDGAICSTGTVNLSATVSGGETVDWYDASTGGTLLLGSSTSYTTPSIASTTVYYAEARNTTTGCLSGTRTAVTATVYATFTSGAIDTAGEAICYNGNPSLIGSATVASGGDTSITYKWQANGNDIFGATSDSYDPPAGLTVTTTYTRYAKDNTCNPTFTLSTGSWVVTISNDNTWTGGTSTAWTTASNWSCGVVPAAVSNVTISTATFYPEISSDVTINSLTLDSGTTLIVNTSNSLSVTDIVDNDGTITLENNAYLLQTNNVTNTGSGSTIVKCNSSSIMRLDYTLWSSPVTGQGLYAFSPLTFANRFYRYLTLTDLYNNSLGFAITGLDANGVNGTDSNNVPFATAKGYLIRTPWNHPTSPTIWTGQFTGLPNNGNIGYTLETTGNQFNAVGNPYPSPISISTFLTDNSSLIGSTLWFWRKTNNPNNLITPTTSYITYSGGTYSSGNEPNYNIQPGQGFIVQATTSGSLQFNNLQRVTTDGRFFRNNTQGNTAGEGRVWLNLIRGTELAASLAIGYKDGATNDFDADFDGKYINDSSLALTSFVQGQELAVQHRATPFADTDVVPLSFKTNLAGTYSIVFNGADGILNTQDVYLLDLLLNQSVDIRANSYSFTSEAGVFADRFKIVYTDNALGIDDPAFNTNQVVIYQNQVKDFVINTGNIVMSSVKVFDIRGRLILEQKEVNDTQTTINVGQTNEVLLVQITSQEGLVVTKKVIR